MHDQATPGIAGSPGAHSFGAALATAYVQRGGKTIRVFTELVRRGPEVDRVTVHFQR